MKLKNKNIFEATRYKKETGQDLPNWQDQLLEYEKQDGYYIHFSYVPRMNLYLVNRYNTPIGFYTYPLKRDKMANFAIERPYAIIVKPKPNAKILQLTDYSDIDLANDIKKLIGFGYSQEIIDKASEEAKFHTAAAKIWNITRVLSGVVANLDESRKLLYEGLSEQELKELKQRAYEIANLDISLKEIIETYEKEFSQEEKEELKKIEIDKDYFIISKFYSIINKPIQISDKVKAYQKEFSQEEKKYLTNQNLGKVYFRKILKSNFEYIENPEEKKQFLKKLSPFEKELLSQSVKLSSYISHGEEERGGGATGKWTNLLRKLGYDGVNDDCLGIIHENEPCQAIFFDVTKVDLVKIIDLKNKEISHKNDLFPSDFNVSKKVATKLQLEKAPADLLLYLTKNKKSDYYVKKAISWNMNTPPEALLFLAKDEEANYTIKKNIANNVNVTPEILELLGNDQDFYIRLIIAKNLKTPKFTLEKLANEDTDNSVRTAAQETLEKLKIQKLTESIIIQKIFSKLLKVM